LIRVADKTGKQVTSQVAWMPLNLFPAKSAIPLEAYFDMQFPAGYQVNVELQTALPVAEADQRYLSARIDNLLVEILSDKLSAEVSGEIWMENERQTSSQVWVAMVAFDEQNNVVGIRRWESGSPVNGGIATPFIQRVYSVGPVIDHVQTFLEARP